MNLDLQRWLNFGSGVGLEIEATRLRVSVVRVRPAGVQQLATHQIEHYLERPAAEWGAEYGAFLKRHGVSHTAAYVVLPRHEVIVRAINLQGVLDTICMRRWATSWRGCIPMATRTWPQAMRVWANRRGC